MATTYTYPFTTPEDYKSIVSVVDIDFQFENAGAGLFNAKEDVQDLISEEAWDELIEHFNSDNYGDGGIYARKDGAVAFLRYGFGHLSLYHNLPFIQVRISNNAITTYKSQDETTAYKYQVDKLSEELLKLAWRNLSKLIVYMNDSTATDFPAWFASEQCTANTELIFSSYKEFDRIYGIDKNAAFFQKCVPNIRRGIEDFLDSRVEDTTAADSDLTALFKQFLVYFSLSEAVEQFDYHFLPAPIRAQLNNEYSHKSGDKSQSDAREKLAGKFWQKAESYLRQIDIWIASQEEPADVDDYGPLDHLQQNVEYDDKHFSLL
jgi:hypothetical protein